jgi:D-alanine-D-alanine ligase
MLNNANGKANVLVLYNYYKSWKPEEYADAIRLCNVMVDGLCALGHRVETVEFWKDVKDALRQYDPNEWIIFQWVEGIEDETGGDARITAELDAMGWTYTGNSHNSLKLSVEKGRVKKVLERWKIPTPPGQEFGSPDEVKNYDIFPSIVKPVSQHCSAGVTKDAVVHDIEQLKERVAFVREKFEEAALAEKFIPGREINVGVWGNGRPRVLPLREIDFSTIKDPLRQMVTWDSKWTPDSDEWNAMPVITQPVVSDVLRAKIEAIALKTYHAFDCRDYARVDMRIDEHDQPYVVDVNPNPDICYDGGFAGACNAAGYTYPEAISNIISMAVARRNRRNALLNTLRKLQTKDAPKPARETVRAPARRRVAVAA